MRRFLLLLLLCTPSLAQMQVVLLGTGFPAPDPDRAGPSTAVIVHDKYFVVDAGRAVTMRLAVLKPRMPFLTAVFLTHLHSDHTDGLPDLYNTAWVMGRKVPFELYGPEGTQAMADAMQKYFAADIHIRSRLTEMLPAEGAKVSVHIVREGVVYKDADVTVTAFAVNHGPVKPAFGYKFESGGKTVVISGDTTYTPNLVKFAQGADILVNEVFLPGTFTHDRSSVASMLESYHTSAAQAGRTAAEAHVKQLVLTHVIRPPQSAEILAAVSQVYQGKTTVGNDLMRFTP